MAEPKSLDDISRQRRWQMKQIEQGRCQICGRPRNRYRDRCDWHQNENRNRSRLSRAVHRAVEEEKNR